MTWDHAKEARRYELVELANDRDLTPQEREELHSLDMAAVADRIGHDGRHMLAQRILGQVM